MVSLVPQLKHYCFYSLGETQNTANSGRRQESSLCVMRSHHAIVEKQRLISLFFFTSSCCDEQLCNLYICYHFFKLFFFSMCSAGMWGGLYLIDCWYLSGDLGNCRYTFSVFSYQLSFFLFLYCLLFYFLIPACFNFYMHLILNFNSV